VVRCLRQFVHDRFLARVFHAPTPHGPSKVAPPSSRAWTTPVRPKDVDLLGELDDIDVALGRLRSAAAVDLGDHFRFIITGHDRPVLGTGQPHVDGYRVHVDAYCGAVKRHTFGVDLVTGSRMTTAPDLQTPTPALNLRGLIPPTLRLYPVVDHIADKLCATQSPYGAAGDRPSSRVRDLVDLVVFARSQDVDGDALIKAIRAKWNHQGLAGDPLFDPTVHWGRLYPPLARTVRKCEGLTRFPSAVGSSVGSRRSPLTGSGPLDSPKPMRERRAPHQQPQNHPRMRHKSQKVRKKFTNRHQIDTGSDTGSLAGTDWVHMPAVNDR